MRILGLDLGVASIGWSLIEVDDITFAPIEILGMGSRIVNLSVDETNAFSKASGETPNSQRTMRRTARKMLQRRKQRRKVLQNTLHRLGMFDREDALNNLPPLELWELRAKAADPANRLTLKELGRVILHLSQKRGYQHARQSSDAESKDTKYVGAINQRYEELKTTGKTLGQMMYAKLKESEVKSEVGKGSVVTFRIKEGDAVKSNLLPRQAHKDELITILKAQQKHYPDVLTDKVCDQIFDIIFYQRPLKSCKGLVNRCEMFDFKFINERGKTVNGSPRVAPKTSPIAQLTHIWETVNNIRLVNLRNKVLTGDTPDAGLTTLEYRKTREVFNLTLDEKKALVAHLSTHDKLTATELLKIVNLKRADGFKSESNMTSAGIKGNKTYTELYKALEGVGNRDELLRFDVQIDETVDEETGEVKLIVNDDIINQPLYRLWHLIYSVPDDESLKRALTEQFGITDPEVLERLCRINFTSAGYANTSVKFMRRILPYLMNGDIYSEACAKAGFRHSDFETKDEAAARELAERIESLEKGALRQPLIEKVLNQMINLVNAVIDQYGPIDEVRVELARELKQNKDKRVKATEAINKNEKVNAANAVKIRELGLPVNRRTLQKYRLWEETEHRCIYCNAPITAAAFLSGELSEVEHIIPRSLFFDDSFSNKTCSCSTCNKAKGQKTAFDFMQSKGEKALLDFQHRVEQLKEAGKISKTKLNRFLTADKDIPTDFIERDLKQTQYISKKAMELLREVVRNVYASSGKVTDFFRNAWGYNRLLETLNLDRYEAAGMVEQNGSRRFIKEWTKRLDHRHHAVDALTVALTRQSYVQRLSTLNASRDEMYAEMSQNFDRDYSLLEQWAMKRPHFSPAQVMESLERVGVSFKAGKKATTPGRDAGKGKRLGVPRGPLHEETIYGRIYVAGDDKPLVKCLKTPEIIADKAIREQIIELMNANNGDDKAVAKLLKKNPITDAAGEPIEKVKTRSLEFIKREKVEALKAKQIDKIVDKAVREAVAERFNECGSEKAFQQSIAERPIYLTPTSPFPIKRVTRLTGLKDSSMVAVKHHQGKPIGFAKTGSNHHVAFYRLADGKVQEMVTSFWIAVKRRNLGLPALITDPKAAWELIEQLPDNTPDIEEVAATLPPIDSELELSLATNEMVVLGMADDEWHDAVAARDFAKINKHLYRVQVLSSNFYAFRRHTHTLTTRETVDQLNGNYVLLASWGALQNANVKPVKISNLGQLILPEND